MIKTKINLSEYQLIKIKNAYEKKVGVKIRLSYEQISKKGEYDVLLTDAQRNKIAESRKQGIGVVLDLTHNQIKTGGFLPILIGIATALAALAGGGTAIANSVTGAKHQAAVEAETKRHNAEMEKIAQNAKSITIGSGIKKKRPNPPAKQFRHHKISE
jgi:hypothetical protein